MEVLNAAGVAPLTSLHKPNSDKKQESKRLPSLRSPKPISGLSTQKLKLAVFLSRSFKGGLAALSSVLGASAAAKALTYEEALRQSIGDSSSLDGSIGFDLGELIDGFVRFGTENPLVVGGGALALAVPLILSQVLGKPKAWGVQSAKFAYASLSEDGGAQLLDIREGSEFKESGSPDLKSLKRKAVSIAYNRDDKEGFLKKLSLRFKEPENTTLYILDKFDGNSELVAQLVATNGFKASYAIKDGAEGQRGWKNSGLPWAKPKKAVALDFDDIKTAITEVLGEGSDGLPVTLGLAAATGLGVLAFSEIETVLQLLGSAALFQFATKKLLFAEDRKVTLSQINEFLNTKVAPQELLDEIKSIGKVLLPVSKSTKTNLATLVEEKSHTSSTKSPIEVIENTAEPIANSPVAKEIILDSLPKATSPLSPYPFYPDFKPPSSPSPSQP